MGCFFQKQKSIKIIYSLQILNWAQYEGKSLFDERLIRTLKNKIYKYMTSILKKSVYW